MKIRLKQLRQIIRENVVNLHKPDAFAVVMTNTDPFGNGHTIIYHMPKDLLISYVRKFGANTDSWVSALRSTNTSEPRFGHPSYARFYAGSIGDFPESSLFPDSNIAVLVDDAWDNWFEITAEDNLPGKERTSMLDVPGDLTQFFTQKRLGAQGLDNIVQGAFGTGTDNEPNTNATNDDNVIEFPDQTIGGVINTTDVDIDDDAVMSRFPDQTIGGFINKNKFAAAIEEAWDHTTGPIYAVSEALKTYPGTELVALIIDNDDVLRV